MVKIIAHRGASMEAPENTLSAFKKAIQMGAHIIECDIQVTKDGVPVILHDDILFKKHINELTLEEVRKWDAGGWFLNRFSGEKAPSLEEFLRLPFGTTSIFFEVKGEVKEKDLQTILHMISKHPPKNYYIGSLLFSVLQALRTLDPTLKRVGIVTSEAEVETFSQLKPEVLALRHQLLTPERISHLKNQGIEIWVWTVDDPTFDFPNIDGVITNNLSRFLQTHGDK